MTEDLIIESPDQSPAPQPGGDPLEKLYGGLHADGKYTKSYDEFKAKYSTPDNIKKLYDGLVEDGDYTKSYDEFNSKYFSSVKKKEDGGAISSIGSELPQNDAIELANQRKENIALADEWDKYNKNMLQTAGVGAAHTSTEEYRKKVADINKRFSDAGFSESDANDMAGLPIGNSFTYDLKEILPLKKTNPEKYQNYLSSIKFQGEIANRIENEKGKDKAVEAMSYMRDLSKPADYTSARSGTQSLISLAENDNEILKNIADARAMVYGQDLPGRKEAIENDPRYIGNDGNLNNYQTIAIQYLEDVDPATASVFNRLLSVKNPGAGLADSKIGFDMKARELERIGIGIVGKALISEINDNPNDLSLREKYNLLQTDISTVSSRYPAAAEMDAQKVIQEQFGSRNGILKKSLLTFGTTGKSANSFLSDILLSPFMSNDDKALRDLEILGDNEFTSLQTYQPSDEQTIRDVSVIVDKDVQDIADTVYNDPSIDPDEKNRMLSDVYKRMSGSINFVPTDSSNKFNFTGKSILSTIGSVGSQIGSQFALSYMLGGSLNAARAKQLSSLMGTTLATSYDQYYSDAIRNNISNPSTYAFTQSTIDAASELLSNDFVMAKRMLGGKGAIGGILEGVTQEMWMSTKKSGVWRDVIQAFGKAAKASAKNAFDESVKEEGAAQLGHNIVSKYAFDQDVEFTDGVTNSIVSTFVGMAPLGFLGLPFKYQEITRNRKYALYDMGLNAPAYLQSIESDLQNQVISPQQAEERRQTVNKAAAAVGATATFKTDGKPLTDNEKTEYAFNQGVLQTIAEQKKIVPPAVQDQLETIKTEIEQKQAVILTPEQVSKNEFTKVVEVHPTETKVKADNTDQAERDAEDEIKPKLSYTPNPNLSESESKIEKSFAEDLNNNYEEKVAKYKQAHGKVINTDNVRELSPDYNENPIAMVGVVHAPSSAFATRMFNDALNKPTESGNAIFTAGGTGAGKSTALQARGMKKLVNNSDFVFDSNLDNQKDSISKIDRTISSGRKVNVVFVYRDIVESFENGVIKRMKKSGRPLPVDYHISKHANALESVRKLQEHYADNPNVDFIYIDNSLGESKAKVVPVEKIIEKSYLRGDEKDRIHRILNDAYGSKSITPEQYRALGGADLRGDEKNVSEGTGSDNRKPNGGIAERPFQPRQNDITEQERFAAKNSWPSYKTKYPDSTMDEYQQHRVSGYKKSVEQHHQSSQSKQNTDQAQDKKTKTIIGRIKVDPIVGGKPKQLSKIIFDVTEGTKQRLFFIKPGKRKFSLGTYSPGNTAIKIKFVNDLDTTAHEIGHSLDDHFGILEDLLTNPNVLIERELSYFSSFGSNPPKGHPNPQAYERAEGFAEFLRALIVNPSLTKQIAPKIYQRYDAMVHPEFRKAIDIFSNDVRTWAGSSGSDIVLANMEWDPKSKDGWLTKLFNKTDHNNEFSISFADRLSANFLNPFRAFNQATNYLKGIKGIDQLSPAEDPEMLTRALLHIGAKVESVLQDGLFDSKLERIKDKDGNVKNLDWLIAPLYNTDATTIEEEMKHTSAYMVAQRTMEYASKFGRVNTLTGIGGGIMSDFDAAEKALNEFKNFNPEKQERIREAADRYREWADHVLRYMVDKGRMSEAVYQNIKKDNEYYVGLQRVMESEPDKEIFPFSQGHGGSLGSKSEPIQKAKGGAETIKNVYVNLIETTNKAIREADRNEAMVAFRNLLTNTRSMYQGAPLRLADIGVQASQEDKNVIPVFVDGKAEYWKFQEDVYKSIKGIESTGYDIPPIITALPKLLRWTVTRSPIFALRNIVRDTQDRILKSNSNSLTNGMGFLDMVGDSKHWKDVAIAGGLNAGYYMKDSATYYGLMGEAINRLSKDKKTILLNPIKMASQSWNGYTKMLEKGETLNRVAEYRAAFKKAKANGMDDYNAMIYAGNKSADLIDFALMGHWMKVINQLVPFSNAAVQGLRSSAVRLAENPLAFTTRVALMTIIPQAILWLLNHNGKDDEEYEALPDYQRDMFWNFKIGDNLWLSAPKPYELGVVASGVDRAMSYMNGHQKSFDGYGGSVAKSIFPVDESAMAGPMRVIVENYANYDFFREKHIVPPGEENLDLALRRGDRASRLAQWISKGFGYSGIQEDPRYIDHAIKGIASYYGNYVVKASNIGREDGEKFGATDWGFFKESPGYNAKSVQQLMDIIEKFKLAKDTNARTFRNLLSASFDAKSPEEKNAAAKALREFSELVLEEMRLKGDKKLKKAAQKTND